MYMHLSVCLLIVFYCLRPSRKIGVLSNEWPLEIKSLLVLLLVVVVVLTRKTHQKRQQS